MVLLLAFNFRILPIYLIFRCAICKNFCYLCVPQVEESTLYTFKECQAMYKVQTWCVSLINIMGSKGYYLGPFTIWNHKKLIPLEGGFLSPTSTLICKYPSQSKKEDFLECN